MEDIANIDKRLAIVETKVDFHNTYLKSQGETLTKISEQIGHMSLQIDRVSQSILTIETKAEQNQEKTDKNTLSIADSANIAKLAEAVNITKLAEAVSLSKLNQANQANQDKQDNETSIKVKIIWAGLSTIGVTILVALGRYLFHS